MNLFISSLLFILISCTLKTSAVKNDHLVQHEQIDEVVNSPSEVNESQIVQTKEIPLIELPELNQKIEIKNYCEKLDRYFKMHHWGKSNCLKYPWKHARNSIKGDPLPWIVFGQDQEHSNPHTNATLILCGVHGDEITPVKFCFDIIDELMNKKMTISNDTLVIIAPLANPDSFFISKPTRTNARGVDVNRNFPTSDWYKKALQVWKNKYASDKRKFPGNKPLSEPEVVFQVNLLNRYNPNKVITVHAPLTLLDYDGPIFGSSLTTPQGEKAKDLLVSMSQMSSGYKISDYPFFPGSLGNYAGNEKQIPTYTLELPDSNGLNSAKFWHRFKPAIQYAIEQNLKKNMITKNEPEESQKQENN